MKRILVALMLFCASMAHAANEFNILDTPSSGGGGTPGGTSGQIQYNSGGTAFGGFGSYNSGTSTVTVPNLVATGSATVASLVSTGAASLGATVVAAPFTVVSGGSTVASVVGNLLTVGSGTTTAAGVQVGNISSGSGGLGITGSTLIASNAIIRYDATGQVFLGTPISANIYVRPLGAGASGVVFTNGNAVRPENDGGFTLGASGTRFSSAFLGSGTAITASAPAIDVSQTWNNAAVAFTAAKINVTNTASAAGSLLQDWQVAGVSKASIDPIGNFTVSSVVIGLQGIFVGNSNTYLKQGTGNALWVQSGNGAITLGASQNAGIANNAAGVVEVNNGTAGTFAAMKLSTLTATAVAPTVAAGQIGFGGTVTTTVGATGAATALPALPLGYIIANVAGTQVKIPYYNN